MAGALLAEMAGDVTAETYGDTTILSDGSTAVAIHGDWLLLSNDVDQVKAAIDVLDGTVASLADDPDFSTAFARVPSGRLGAAYVDVQSFGSLLDLAAGMAAGETGVDLPIADLAAMLPTDMVMYLAAEPDRLDLEVIVTPGEATPTLPLGESELASLFPADTQVYVEARELGAAIESALDGLVEVIAASPRMPGDGMATWAGWATSPTSRRSSARRAPSPACSAACRCRSSSTSWSTPASAPASAPTACGSASPPRSPTRLSPGARERHHRPHPGSRRRPRRDRRQRRDRDGRRRGGHQRSCCRSTRCWPSRACPSAWATPSASPSLTATCCSGSATSSSRPWQALGRLARRERGLPRRPSPTTIANAGLRYVNVSALLAELDPMLSFMLQDWTDIAPYATGVDRLVAVGTADDEVISSRMTVIVNQ